MQHAMRTAITFGLGTLLLLNMAQTAKAATPQPGRSAQSVRNAMTWGKNSGLSDPTRNLTFAGCWADSGGCDPYVGDTPISTALPILCLKEENLPNPGLPVDYYHGWVGGPLGLTAPVRGTDLPGLAYANRLCEQTFGSGYRMAEFHDRVKEEGSGGWGFWGLGNLDGTSRFWVYINDQDANPWGGGEGQPLEDVLNCTSVTGIYPGQQFQLAVDARFTAPGSYGLGTTVQTDPAVAQPQAASFGTLFPPGSLEVKLADPAAGTETLAQSLKAPALPFAVPVAGRFADITYQAMNAGSTTVSFANTVVTDRDGNVLPSTVGACQIDVLDFGGIDGIVKYQGRSAHANIQATATGPVVQSTQTDVLGQYSLGALWGGNYNVEVDAPLYLSRCTIATVTSGATTHLAETRLLGGDIAPQATQNNLIDIGDFALLGASYGQNTPAADINADGTVNVQDLSIMGGNWGAAGCTNLPWN